MPELSLQSQRGSIHRFECEHWSTMGDRLVSSPDYSCRLVECLLCCDNGVDCSALHISDS
jgi:hypothetical protein